MNYHKYVTLSAITLCLSGCVSVGTLQNVTSQDGSEVESITAETSDYSSSVLAAIQNANRSETDTADDVVRKAEGVLNFAGVGPGMSVLELEAGGGYYTELLSYITGFEGNIMHQNPAAFDDFLKEEDITARFGADGNRLPNVTRHKSNFDDLSFAADGSVDMVTWFLGPHELWYPDENGDLTLGEPAAVYSEIFRVLKPGGKFIALDHKAAPGTPETSGGSTHRIDPAHIRKSAGAAGLKFSKESNLLANPTDDYEVIVFDPSVRRKTDRFLHIYVKPN